ncbi:MAG: zinc ABC transporter substrate-binding protein, partial [Paracoccaceae bacterium]|nr:zinc ABC transporter substrate-binding protein [Paracoccaceae bacterium]
MSNKIISISTALMFGGSIACADVPKVAVDIAPVHSLVARVMNGVGTPNLIIPAGASPHEYQLRPSEAKAIQEANLVFWMGEDLTPWLEKALSSLAESTPTSTLLEIDGIELLDFREGALFEAHDHDDHKDHDDHQGHAHGDHDPHAWLSPTIAKVWLNEIAAKLSAIDPNNAGSYFSNAASAR